jgi:hypothetical protein
MYCAESAGYSLVNLKVLPFCNDDVADLQQLGSASFVERNQSTAHWRCKSIKNKAVKSDAYNFN